MPRSREALAARAPRPPRPRLRLTFLGTRGGIEARSRRHRRHSSLLVEVPHGRVLIDCGDDWRGRLDELAPDAILVTHAHPDHAGGLADGAPCAVYASPATSRALSAIPLDLHVLAPHRATTIAGLVIEPFPVVHSLLAPASGYRIAKRVFYVPDVVDIRAKRSVLRGIAVYIGDGARLVRPLVRKTASGRRFGHTSIRTQLAWCRDAGVNRAIFTHCGTEVVTASDRAEAIVQALGREHGIAASLARDGLVVEM